MLNHITIMGRLTRDPELRRTGSGVAVASFRVAVERDFQQKGEEKKADFIDCVAWRQTGEFVSKYFGKGAMIVVDGRLEIREWTDKDGGKRTTAEVVAAQVYFGESRQTAENKGAAPAASPSGYTETEAALNRYGQSLHPADDYGFLSGDDDQLPFD